MYNTHKINKTEKSVVVSRIVRTEIFTTSYTFIAIHSTLIRGITCNPQATYNFPHSSQSLLGLVSTQFEDRNEDTLWASMKSLNNVTSQEVLACDCFLRSRKIQPKPVHLRCKELLWCMKNMLSEKGEMPAPPPPLPACGRDFRVQTGLASHPWTGPTHSTKTEVDIDYDGQTTVPAQGISSTSAAYTWAGVQTSQTQCQTFSF